MLLRYFLYDFDIVLLAPVITGIKFVSTFHTRCISVVKSLFQNTLGSLFIIFIIIIIIIIINIINIINFLLKVFSVPKNFYQKPLLLLLLLLFNLIIFVLLCVCARVRVCVYCLFMLYFVLAL
jgi:hypothetical protein